MKPKNGSDFHVHVYLSSSSQVAHKASTLCHQPALVSLVSLRNEQVVLAGYSVQLERDGHGIDARVTKSSL